MDRIDSKGSDLDVDLESGGTTSEEDASKDPSSTDEHAKKLLGRVWSGLLGLDGTTGGGNGLTSYNGLLNSGEITVANVQILSDKYGQDLTGSVGKKLKEKRNKMSSKKPPKPPRPPVGPSLDAADLKLVREISELALLKRKRIERMKALKKMKAEKPMSFNSNLFAMIVTVLFCFVIIFQGLLGSRI